MGLPFTSIVWVMRGVAISYLNEERQSLTPISLFVKKSYKLANVVKDVGERM